MFVLKSCINRPGGVSGVRFRNSLLWEFLELPNSLYLNPSSLFLLSPLLSSILVHELDQARQTFSLIRIASQGQQSEESRHEQEVTGSLSRCCYPPARYTTDMKLKVKLLKGGDFELEIDAGAKVS